MKLRKQYISKMNKMCLTKKEKPLKKKKKTRNPRVEEINRDF